MMNKLRRSALVALSLLGIILFTASPAQAQAEPPVSTPLYWVVQHDGFCMHIANNNTNGTRYVQQPCAGTVNQQFFLERITPGTQLYWFKNMTNRKCMTVSGASTQNGAPLFQWDCAPYQGAQSQQWWDYQALPSGGGWLVNRNSGKCVDLTGATWVGGEEFHQWDCHQTPRNQDFIYVGT